MSATSGAPRVAWVADCAWPPRSGIGNYTYQLTRLLATTLGGLDLIHYGRRPPLFDAPHAEVELPGWMQRRFLRRLLPALHPAVRADLDIIHFPTEFELWYLRPGRARRVVTIHGCAGAVLPPRLHEQTSPALVRRLSRALRAVEGIVTVSEASADEISRVYGLPRERLMVIPNGVSETFHLAVPAAADWYERELGIRGPYLLSVGLMIPKKNTLTALEVWRLLEAQGLKLTFVQVGQGGVEAGRVREWVQRAGLGERFVATGFRDEETLARLYAGAACLLHPSYHEGFGLPVAEAMAAGCPVVASRIPALIEVSAGTAALFEPEDAAGLAGEAKRLIADAGYRARIVEPARARARSFSWDTAAATLADLYRRL